MFKDYGKGKKILYYSASLYHKPEAPEKQSAEYRWAEEQLKHSKRTVHVGEVWARCGSGVEQLCLIYLDNGASCAFCRDADFHAFGNR